MLAIVMASYLMLLLDISIVITGLPRIQELGFSPTGLSWVQNAYTLAFGGLLLLGARAGDLLGRRRMFLAGIGVFTLASLWIGLAPTPAWMLAGRAVQGVGAAILAPATLALLSTHFAEGPERARAIGYYAATAGLGGSLGLVLGGLLTDWISWRAGFFINVPVGMALAWGARRYLADTAPHPGELDAMSALSSTLGMGALVYGLVHAADHGWANATTQFALGGGALLLVLLVWNEARAAHPIMPLRLFANRERAGAYGARLLFLGGMIGFWFFGTQFLQGVLGYGPAQAGLAFLPATIPNFLAAVAAPALVRRIGNAATLALGLLVSVLGMAWLAQADAHSSYLADIALPMVLVGIGQGGSLGPLTAAAIAGVEARDAGAASGLVNAAHQLGAALGLAILVVVFASAATAAPAGHAAALAHQVTAALTGSTLLLFLALVVVLATSRAPLRD